MAGNIPRINIPFINDVEHLFICSLAIRISLEKCLFKFFAHFFFLSFFLTGGGDG